MKILALNKQAKRDYAIQETFEAGLVLKGSEVKSAKLGNINLKGSYSKFVNGKLQLINAHIGHYKFSHPDHQHDELRSRELLLKKVEIRSLIGLIKQKNLTLVPLVVYNKKGRVKVELGLGKGKKKHDKRQDIKKREAKRAISREMKQA